MSKASSSGKRSVESDIATNNIKSSTLEEENTSNNQNVPEKKKQRLVDGDSSISEHKDIPSTAARHTSTATPNSISTPTLYVSNLHSRISEPHLQKLFQRFGEIIRINLIRRTGGGGSGGVSSSTSSHYYSNRSTQQRQQQNQQSSYTYAFVQFKTVQSAINAMEKVNGLTLLGKSLVVKPAHAKEGFANYNDGESGFEDTQQVSSQNVKKQRNNIESKIEALKKTLIEKQSKTKSK